MRHDTNEEFDSFASAAWPRLRWTAYLLVGDVHLAEDLAQTALVKTYASWRKVRREDAMAYSRRILVNANIDRLRRRRGVHEQTLETYVDDGSHEPTAMSASVDDRDAVVRLLATLAPQERRVVILRYVYDLSEPMVAVELGISVGTLKSTTSRALAKLRVTHDEQADPRSVVAAAPLETDQPLEVLTSTTNRK